MLKKQIFAVLFSILLIMNHVSTQQSTKPTQQSTAETFEFTTQVTRLMDILINSLYTQKQIFLRQVISNGSDALDKIRFMALTDPQVLGQNKDLQIRIEVNEQQKYVQIRDTGVGMTKQQLIQNLGTIAKSGTTNFLEALKTGNINLIGQFGVGFYSTFLAGSKVQVISKSNADDTQYIWTSDASSYQIKPDPQGNTLGRGTIVRIYLKEDAQQFLNHKRILKLVKKYSEFIDFPIYINNKKEIEQEVPVQPEQEENSSDDLEITQKEQTKPNTEKVKRTVFEWELINTDKALWLREKDQIYEQDYIDFYKALSKQSNPPMNWIHFNTEGQVVFSSILYIPNRAPQDFYGNYNNRKNDVRLYVRRVLITDQNTELIPKYLSFIMGVIDSDDLPLNVNRQTLQQTKTFKIINQKITKKILDMITEISKWEYVEQDQYEEDFEYQFEEQQIQAFTEEELAQKKKEARQKYLNKNKERYEKFYNQFGKAIKLGILEDKTNRNKLASLSRWYSTRSPTERISFDDYIKHMKSVQDQIYYFSGEDRAVLEKSPLVVGLARRGYQVILCDDPIDQYVFNTLREYEGKNIVNVGKGDFKMPDDDQFQRKKLKFLTKKYEPLVEYAKKLLFEKVGNVIVSNRLTNQPCVVVADSYGHSSFMDKIQKAQMFAGANDNPTSDFKKIMEINPHHKINQIILQKINKNQVDTELEQLIELLYETAAFHSGFSAKDPNDFVNRFYKTYSKALGVLSLQRQQIEIDRQKLQLDSTDFQGQNEQILRVSPDDIKISAQSEEDIV